MRGVRVAPAAWVVQQALGGAAQPTVVAAAENAEDGGTWTARDRRGGAWRVDLDFGGCVEVATPILRGVGDLRAVSHVAQALAAAGAYPGHATGLHIHVDAAALGAAGVVRLLALLRPHEPFLHRAIGIGSDREVYCRPMRRDVLAALISAQPQSMAALWTAMLAALRVPPESDLFYLERFRGINLTNLASRRKHTVEFRYFNASLCPEEIAHAHTLTLALTRAARHGGDCLTGAARSWGALADAIRLPVATTAYYWLRGLANEPAPRALHLAAGAGRAGAGAGSPEPHA